MSLSFFLRCLLFVLLTVPGLSAKPEGLDPAGTVGVVGGGLVWDSTRAEVRVAASAAGADGVFRFKNTADRSVTILSVTSSCGCTAGKLARQVYAPGESGAVEAHFKVNGRSGLQVNWLTVTTDAGGDPARLEFKVDIFEHLTLSPRFVVWKRGEGEGTAKEVEIRLLEAGAVESVEATPADPRVEAVVKPGADPTRWTLSLRPLAGGEGLRSQVVVKARTQAAGPVESRVFVQVR